MQRQNSSVPLPHTRAVEPRALRWPKAPTRAKQVWTIRIHLQREQRVRDLAMFDQAIDSKLHGCYPVKLKIGQVVVNAAARHRATIVQQKTERPVHRPVAAFAMIKKMAGEWIKELFDLPRKASFAFTTGCQLAHMTGLAAARHVLLKRTGWDVEQHGRVPAVTRPS